MTVVVAHVGENCAVMASDSEATESGHTRYDVEKIWTAGGLLIGMSGSFALRQRAEPAIADLVAAMGSPAEMPCAATRDQLVATMQPILHAAYSAYVGPNAFAALGSVLLVCGRDADGYWLIEIDQHNTATEYTDQRFHTVGSGSAAAYVARAVMSGYIDIGRSASHLRLIAYRTVKTCIDGLGGNFGVGGDVRLWSAEDGKPFAQASSVELGSLMSGLEQWRTVERETLNAVVRPEAMPYDASSPGMPPALDAPEM